MMNGLASGRTSPLLSLKGLGRTFSDHYLIYLTQTNQDWGHKPFKIINEGVSINNTWIESVSRG